jgi:hypothetical protein
VKAAAGAAAIGLAAVLAAGCGAASHDLFIVERPGALPGARLTLVVDDGGFVRCDGGERRQISSQQLIDARELARALDGEELEPGPARRGISLPASERSLLRFYVRTENGSVRFADTSPDQPPELPRIAQLTRELAKQVCGLPR